MVLIKKNWFFILKDYFNILTNNFFLPVQIEIILNNREMHFKTITWLLRWRFLLCGHVRTTYRTVRLVGHPCLVGLLQESNLKWNSGGNHQKSSSTSRNWMLGLWWYSRTGSRTLLWLLESSVIGFIADFTSISAMGSRLSGKPC